MDPFIIDDFLTLSDVPEPVRVGVLVAMYGLSSGRTSSILFCLWYNYIADIEMFNVHARSYVVQR
jgi:hypothetical protein